MIPWKFGLRLAPVPVILAVAWGCGGVDESNFSPTKGSPDPNAATSPAEIDAKVLKKRDL